MPSTAVYLEALPLLIALIAACLMLSGVSKSGSPTPRTDHVAAGGLEGASQVGHGDGWRWLDAHHRVGEERHGGLR